jgi:phage gp45-like
VSLVVPVLRAVVRDELSDVQPLALGSVTAVQTNADGSGAHNVEVNVRMHGSELELQRVPVVAGRIGLSAAPREGDTAVIAFVGGDLNGPVALGFLHDDQRHPPKADPDEVVYEVRDDGSSARRVEVVLTNGNTVTILDDHVKITMGDTKVDVEADGDVKIEAAGNIELKAGGDMKIEAGGSLTAKGGNDATFEGGSSATVKGGASATLKGPSTTIAGNTSFSPS